MPPGTGEGQAGFCCGQERPGVCGSKAGREQYLRENRAMFSAVGINRDQFQCTGSAFPYNHRNISPNMYLKLEGSLGRAITLYFQQFPRPGKGQEKALSHSYNSGPRNEFFRLSHHFYCGGAVVPRIAPGLTQG